MSSESSDVSETTLNLEYESIEEIVEAYNINYTSEENGYQMLILDILTFGKRSRDDTENYLVGKILEFSLKEQCLPLPTLTRVPWKSILKELLYFMHGGTDSCVLEEQNVRLWSNLTSDETHELRGLDEYKTGDLGPMYGFQWRHFGATYRGCEKDYTNEGFDQLAHCIQTLRDRNAEPSAVLTSWNPAQKDDGVASPGLMMIQFVRTGKILTSILHYKSGDLYNEIPYTISRLAFLTHIIARLSGLLPHKMILMIGYVCIKVEDFTKAGFLCNLKTLNPPKIQFSEDCTTLENLRFESIFVDDYHFQTT